VKSKNLLSKLEKAHGFHRLKRIVIDEAHCCSEWGHDFRPDYHKLNMIKISFGSVPLMCLTATATFQVSAPTRPAPL
jgi:ATP-dependent DNA helicase Q1